MANSDSDIQFNLRQPYAIAKDPMSVSEKESVPAYDLMNSIHLEVSEENNKMC